MKLTLNHLFQNHNPMLRVTLTSLKYPADAAGDAFFLPGYSRTITFVKSISVVYPFFPRIDAYLSQNLHQVRSKFSIKL